MTASPKQRCQRNILPEVVYDWGLAGGTTLRSRWRTIADWSIHERHAGGEGSEVPIVFVHGLVISSLYFIPLAECLAKDFPVHLPDQPGFGLSEGPAQPPTVMEMAAWLICWMDAAGIECCHLVANSLGCQIATAIAVQAPEKVHSLCLIGPTVDARARGFWSQARRILWDAPHEPIQLWINHLVDQIRAGCTRVWRMIFHMLDDRIEHRLPAVTQPTAIIRGANDPSAPADWAATVCELLPNARMITLPGWHCVHYTDPGETASVIRNFIRAVTLSKVSV